TGADASLPGSASAYQTIFAGGVPTTGIDPRLPNEINYVGGFDVAVNSYVTLSADILGRALLDTERFGVGTQTFNYRTATSGPLLQTTRDAFDITGKGTLNLMLGILTAKINIPGTPLLLTGNLLFPLTDAGLKPKVTPVVGFDYSFGK